VKALKSYITIPLILLPPYHPLGAYTENSPLLPPLLYRPNSFWGKYEKRKRRQMRKKRQKEENGMEKVKTYAQEESKGKCTVGFRLK
jgi:hypothetical protein